MANLSQSAMFAVSTEARGPITAGIAAAAVAIANEDPSTPNHEARISLAHRVLNDPERSAANFAWAISSNATVVDKWVDGDVNGAVADLAFVINTVWDAIALAAVGRFP